VNSLRGCKSWPAISTPSHGRDRPGLRRPALIILASAWRRAFRAISSRWSAATVVVACSDCRRTIGSRFGGIPSGLPHLVFPRLRLDLLHAVSLACDHCRDAGAIES